MYWLYVFAYCCCCRFCGSLCLNCMWLFLVMLLMLLSGGGCCCLVAVFVAACVSDAVACVVGCWWFVADGRCLLWVVVVL